MLRGCRARREQREVERGETLVELLVAIVLLGTIVVAVLGGFLSLTKVSDYNRQATQANLYSQTFAEQLKQPVGGWDYIPSAKPGGPPPAVGVAGTPGVSGYPTFDAAKLPQNDGAVWKAQIVEIEYLGSTTTNGAGRTIMTFNTSCTPTPATTTPVNTVPSLVTDLGVQRIYVDVYSGSRARPAKETVVIIKRDQRCPTSFNNVDAGPC